MPLALLFVLWVTSCTTAFRAPSAVGRGELYRTGEPTYDRFFRELYDKQLELNRTPQQEETLRQQLGRQLGTTAITPEALASAVRARATELRQRGIEIALEVDSDELDEEAAVKVETRGNLSDDDRALVEAIRVAVAGELGIVTRMAQQSEDLERLGVLAEALERQSTRVFGKWSLDKPAEVKTNLEDARTLISLMRVRCHEIRVAARRTWKKLVRAARTVESPSVATLPPPSLPQAPVEEPKPATRVSPKGTRSKETPAPQPAGGARPARSPTRDFEP